MRRISLLAGLFLLSMHLLAQQGVVSGKVTDAAGKPIFNATVLIKGSSSGTTTKEDGSYSLMLTPSAKILVFSSIGLSPLEVSISGKSVISVSLQVARNDLDEVVVVGYGTQKKSTLTTSQVKVGGDKLENVPFSSIDQTLQGKVAGLQSITSTGQPGANQAIRIRGIGSMNTNAAQPLFVVDGVQINSGDLTRNTTTSNTLAGLNPDDIERVDVLKDAAATAIYGSRGGNGVILITTKKGKAGKTRLVASTEIGANTFARLPDNARPLGAADWLALAKEGMANAGTYTPAQITANLHAYGDTSNIDTDWFGLMTRTGKQQQVNVSLSGGDEKTTFYASGGFFNQDASVRVANLKRYSGALNIRHKASKNLLVDFTMMGSYQNQNTPLGGSSFSNPMTDIYFLRPTQNPYNADGTLNISRVGALNFQSGITHNPLYTLTHNIYNTKITQFKPNLYVEYTILKGLSISSRLGTDYNSIEEFQYWNPNNGDGYAYGGYGFAYYNRYFLYDWTNQANYHTSFLKDGALTMDLKVGYEAVYNNTYLMTSTANAYSTDKLPDLVFASTYVSATNNGSDYRFSSGFSNAVFTYDHKYSLSASFRRDGSSRFGADRKYGNFYSVGGAWNASEELFLKDVNFISLLKVRGSYGKGGNAEIGNYTANPLQNGGYNYNGVAGQAYETIGNVTLGWENDKQLDFGVDVGLLKNRLNFIVDWYKRNSEGLLYAKPISPTTGFISQNSNIAGLQNQGIELTINATPVQTKDFRWDVSLNITHNTNKITSLPNNNADILGADTYFRLHVGQDYRSFYLNPWAGVDANNGDALWYTDSSKTKTTNDYLKSSKAYIGKSASPKYFGGFSNTITYKGFSLTADLTFNFGNYVYDRWGSYFTDGIYALSYGRYRSNLNRWTTPGQITNVPKYVYNPASKSINGSSRFLYQGDYVRLRNLEIGYTAPSAVANRIKMNSLRFYVRGSNLYSWIKDKNIPFDPEQGVNSFSNLTVFLTKSLTAGVVIGL